MSFGSFSLLVLGYEMSPAWYKDSAMLMPCCGLYPKYLYMSESSAVVLYGFGGFCVMTLVLMSLTFACCPILFCAFSASLFSLILSLMYSAVNVCFPIATSSCSAQNGLDLNACIFFSCFASMCSTGPCTLPVESILNLFADAFIASVSALVSEMPQ